MIDERSRRREDFDEDHSAPVVLADGQTYYLPKPRIIHNPVFENGKLIRTWPFLTVGKDLDALVRAIVEQENGILRVHSVMQLGAFLLLKHYDLSDDDLNSLISYTDGDEQSRDMVRAIWDTATGTRAPKASSAGAA